MRPFTLALPVLLLTMSCNQKPPVVNITTVSPEDGNVSFTSAYDIDEGSSLDLVVDAAAGATVTTSTLPMNATFTDGIFSFSPSYSQSGLYSVTFTITTATGASDRTIGIRVLNVIHVAAPPATAVKEGEAAPELTFKSTDPDGTIVTFSADLTSINAGAIGKATFDSVSGKLNFSPGFRWLDTRPAALAINVTAEGQEIDTGKTRTSIAKVIYNISEATSFDQEIKPIFLYPNGRAPSDTSPSSKEGRGCIASGCHDGTSAGANFGPDTVYDQLVNHDIAADGVGSATCASEAAQGMKRVIPSDPNKSLFYLKIAGVDGASTTETDNTDPPCGVQMPNNQFANYLTVTDEEAWEACPADNDACRLAYRCVDADVACKTNARLIRKARLWIEAGALKN